MIQLSTPVLKRVISKSNWRKKGKVRHIRMGELLRTVISSWWHQRSLFITSLIVCSSDWISEVPFQSSGSAAPAQGCSLPLVHLFSSVDKYLRKRSTPSTIRKIQIKTALRFYLTQLEWLPSGEPTPARMWKRRNPFSQLVGIAICGAALEISRRVSQNSKNRTTLWPTLGQIPKGLYINTPQRSVAGK